MSVHPAIELLTAKLRRKPTRNAPARHPASCLIGHRSDNHAAIACKRRQAA